MASNGQEEDRYGVHTSSRDDGQDQGQAVRSYVVSWREPVRDEFGAIVPGSTVQRTETFETERRRRLVC